MWRILSFAIAVAVAVPSLGWANSRRPVFVDVPNASALKGAMPELVVKSEQLRFACDGKAGGSEPSACAVEASYSVEAAAACTVTLDFVLPATTVPACAPWDGGAHDSCEYANREYLERFTSSGLTAEINRRPAPVTLHPEERPKSISVWADTAALEGARFTGTLEPGLNQIVVRYRQHLSLKEASTDQLVSFIGYEVWPLKEWKLASDFRLSLLVSTPREEPGFFTRTFSDPLSAQCRGDGQLLPGAFAQQKAQLAYDVVLEKLPDRLVCLFGAQKPLGVVTAEVARTVNK